MPCGQDVRLDESGGLSITCTLYRRPMAAARYSRGAERAEKTFAGAYVSGRTKTVVRPEAGAEAGAATGAEPSRGLAGVDLGSL